MMKNILSAISGKLKLVKDGVSATLGNVANAESDDEVPNKGQMDAAIEAATLGGGTTFPTDPVDYEKFFKIPDGDNLDGKLYTWNGSDWV